MDVLMPIRTKVLITAIVAMLAAAFGGTIAGAPAQADQIGPAYYLYHTVDTSHNANCATNGLRAFIGTVSFSPYYTYRTIRTGSNQAGTLQHIYYNGNGFKTAGKYHSCVNFDFSFSYYGFAKVQRKITQTWICYSGGCSYGGTLYGPWKNVNWTG